MNALLQTMKAAMWVSLAFGIFLAFGWPFAVSPDPAGEAFRVLATGSLVVFLVSLAGVVVLNVALRRIGFAARE